MSRAAVLMAASLLAACTTPAPEPTRVPYEVKVPVYIERTAPGELSRPYVPTEYPEFVSPTAPGAVYALTKEGWQRLQVILRTLHTRDQAWRDWANGHGEPK